MASRSRGQLLAAGFAKNATRRDFRIALPMGCARLRLAVWPRLDAPRMRSERLLAMQALRNSCGIHVPLTSGDLPRPPCPKLEHLLANWQMVLPKVPKVH